MSDAAVLKESLPRPSQFYRWLVLIFVSLAMFGNYYFYDALSPLADLLVKQLHFTDANIGLLKAAYSFPNIFTVVIGGVIIDRIGLRRSHPDLRRALLCGLDPHGAHAALYGSWPPGDWSSAWGPSRSSSPSPRRSPRWFKGKELSFAFGINLTFARLGSFAAQNSPTWAKPAYVNWRYPFLIGVGLCSLCVIGAFFYWLLDAYAENHYHLGKAGATDKVVFRDLFKFSLSYWYIVALCVFYSAIFPFQTFAVKFFMDAHGTTREFGGFCSSMLTLFAMIATPLFGLMVDKIGKRALFMMFGSLLLIPVYLMMAYTHVCFYVPMAMMGVAFSLVPAIMWPSVAYIVDQKKLGTAYGVMTMSEHRLLRSLISPIGWANDYWNASAANPRGYDAGDVDLLGAGFRGAVLRLPAAQAGDRAARPRAGDHHHRDGGRLVEIL